MKDMKQVVVHHLKKLNIKKKDKLVIYSNLSSFGLKSKKIANLVLTEIKKILGPKGTLIMPTYILGVTPDFIFDYKKIHNSSSISNLAKHFFKQKNIIRSMNPIHSHIGLGKAAKFLKISKYKSSYGINSDFYFMKKKKFKLILLGCEPMQGVTYLHHLECLLKVPYRKWIKIKKKILFKKKLINLNYNYYALKDNSFVSNFNPVFNSLKKLGANIKSVRLKYGNSYSISFDDLDKYSRKILKHNPYAFVKRIK